MVYWKKIDKIGRYHAIFKQLGIKILVAYTNLFFKSQIVLIRIDCSKLTFQNGLKMQYLDEFFKICLGIEFLKTILLKIQLKYTIQNRTYNRTIQVREQYR